MPGLLLDHDPGDSSPDPGLFAPGAVPLPGLTSTFGGGVVGRSTVPAPATGSRLGPLGCWDEDDVSSGPTSELARSMDHSGQYNSSITDFQRALS